MNLDTAHSLRILYVLECIKVLKKRSDTLDKIYSDDLQHIINCLINIENGDEEV